MKTFYLDVCKWELYINNKYSGCNFVFFGIMSQHLQTRNCEHMGILPLTGIAIKTLFSFVHDHFLKTCHNSNFDDFQILYKPWEPSTQPIWKYIYIKKHRPNLNIQNDAVIFYVIF